MELPIFQVDAFTDRVFSGNPAAVMPLPGWLDDTTLQAIAMENNLSETAFLVQGDAGFELRWFTPTVEVELCGHATLATGHVLFEHLGYAGEAIAFHTRSGELRVHRAGTGLTLDFPESELATAEVDTAICDALGGMASEALTVGETAHSLLYVYEFEEDVAGLSPDFPALCAASRQCVIATAPGNDCDFVSRFFAPQFGIDEDPVTGSAHCSLVPYWAGRLQTPRLQARQISARGGQLACELRNGRVFMTGSAVTFMRGTVLQVE
jgi:PhzF family phenazine biosynthesis protein